MSIIFSCVYGEYECLNTAYVGVGRSVKRILLYEKHFIKKINVCRYIKVEARWLNIH